MRADFERCRWPRCGFYIRTVVSTDPLLYEYEKVALNGPQGTGNLVTSTPPAIGDLIHLWDTYKKTGGTFRVLERSWGHAEYGSVTWPYGEPEPKEGPLLHIIVEKSKGPFVNEAPNPVRRDVML